MNFEATYGVYPTMITPYQKTARTIMLPWTTRPSGIGSAAATFFADCQSSEIQFLTLDERVNILHTVMQAASIT